MKKYISYLLLLCMMLSIFACAKAPIIIYDDNEEIDFLGTNLNVYMDNLIGQVTKKGGSSSLDREYERMVDTQNKFNFVFTYNRVESVSNTFLAGALSGGLQADLMKDYVDEIYKAYKINALLPIENIVSDASSEKWRGAGQSEYGVFNGKQYSFFPYYWEKTPTIFGFINLNMTTLESYGISSPHDIIEAGEWDWEHFKDFLKQTTFTEGTTVWRGMGMASLPGETMLPFILSNGGKYITYDNGRYTASIDSEESLEALKFAASLVNEGLMSDIPTGSSDFANGLGWMLYSGGTGSSPVYKIEAIRYPYGPNGNKDTVSTITTGDTVYAFPIFSAFSEEEMGAVVEYMFEPLSDLYPNGWKDIVCDTIFFYDTDYDYYIKGVENAEYLDKTVLSESYSQLSEAMRLVLYGSATPEVAVESVIDLVQADLNNNYNNEK